MPEPTHIQRDERVTVLKGGPPDTVNLGTAKGWQPQGARYKGPAKGLDTTPAKDAEEPAFMQVVEDKTVTAKEPDRAGSRVLFRAGKIISSAHYDFADLRKQGLKLAPPGEVNTGLSSGGQGISLADTIKALQALGLEIVPKGTQLAGGTEIAELRAEIAQLKQSLGESSNEGASPAKTRGNR